LDNAGLCLHNWRFVRLLLYSFGCLSYVPFFIFYSINFVLFTIPFDNLNSKAPYLDICQLKEGTLNKEDFQHSVPQTMTVLRA